MLYLPQRTLEINRYYHITEVTAGGVGSTTVNVGDSGEAFEVADRKDVRVIDLLLATNQLSSRGLLYDLNGDCLSNDDEVLLRTLANDVYRAINEQGGR